MEREQIESVIESLLFVAGEPLSLKRLCDVISEAERGDVRGALDELRRRYEGPGSGLRVVEVAGGYQLQTPADNAPWVGRLLQSRPVRLSRASIETLAIVAYRQPATRAEIEEIRGVDSGGVLKTLLDYGFVRIAGRKDVPGKPLIYATDRKFMEFFRLKSLSDLPTLREMEDIQENRLSEAEKQGYLPLEDPAGADEELAGETGEGDGGQERVSVDIAGPANGEDADDHGADESDDPADDREPAPDPDSGKEPE